MKEIFFYKGSNLGVKNRAFLAEKKGVLRRGSISIRGTDMGQTELKGLCIRAFLVKFAE